nr:hypothetical protein [Tanacetum cinerariifolium]
MGLPEDIYVAIDSCDTAQEIWIRVEQMMKGKITRNHNRYNAVQNVRNQVRQHAVQNQEEWVILLGTAQSDQGEGMLQLLIAQKEEAGIQLQAEEFDLMATVGDIDKIT